MTRLLRILAFGLWTGVMIGFAFLFAPIAFSVLGPVLTFAELIGRVIGSITVFGYACAALVVLAAMLERFASLRAKITALFAVVMAALGWFEMHAVVPVMRSTPIETPAYQGLHHESSTIYSAILLLGLAGLVWSAWQEGPNAA
ncbi:MAG TPA: DUF4149 domain-containing protein [Candidatus Baltobacteraceae bacterium]|nr:DUF4149 domain-containing protein [Candidatus Baltobacteraceae bacterium]